MYKNILYYQKYEKGDRPPGRVRDRLSLNPDFLEKSGFYFTDSLA
ncbi:hypothetical protein [Nostoc mirabile]|nr:hypothetical protein [Nostoc mirabile]